MACTVWSRSIDLDLSATEAERLLDVRARDASTWHLLEVTNEHPVEVTLGWASSYGAWSEAMLTLTRGGRVCLLCAGLRVDVRPLGTASGTAKVQAALAPGFSQTHNVYEELGEVQSAVPLDVDVPALAQTVEVFPADLSALGTTTIQLRSGSTVLAELGLSDIPDGGLRLGSATSIRISGTSTVPVQCVFHLSF